jgi:hypothetical protein
LIGAAAASALQPSSSSARAGPATAGCGYAFLAAALALNGHDAEARETLQRYLAMPDAHNTTIAAFKKNINSNNPGYLSMRERVYVGLRKAGMPDE